MLSRIDAVPDAVTSIAILTYHSISDEPGPTSISATTFHAQMSAISELGVDVVSLDQVERWRRGEIAFNRRSVAITFDDAFRDFADAAFPVLARFGFASCVFVPTSVVGGVENWIGANHPPRALMDWDTIRQLSGAGVTFGSHTRTHADLTTLDDAELDAELSGSRRALEDMLGKPAPHFAPPYGRSNARGREAIARHYSLSVGVRLGEANQRSPIHDLPRIEMHYYRNLPRWRAFLERRGGAYFQTRRAARGLREAAEGAARRLVLQGR
jgi:peptidoglycan/xylan/chitin deacetylase (PgdA/CDA1 family)